MINFTGVANINYDIITNIRTIIPLSNKIKIITEFDGLISFKLEFMHITAILIYFGKKCLNPLSNTYVNFNIKKHENNYMTFSISSKSQIIISDLKFLSTEQNNEINIYNNYESKNELNDYIKYSNPNININLLQNINSFAVDSYFYSYVNSLIQDKQLLLKNISDYGFEHGYIYHPKQLLNLFPDIKIKINFINKIVVDINSISTDINIWVNQNLYSKNFDFYMQNFIKCKIDNMLFDCELFILVFIGDEIIGFDLVNKIIKYKLKQNFGLGIVFRCNDLYTTISPLIINNFTNYAMYVSNEFGNDIIPTLLMYYDLKSKIKLNYIIKLQTKQNVLWYSDLTDYLLDKNLNKLTKLLNKNYNNSNSLGHKSYYLNIDVEKYTNYKLKKKYYKYTNKKMFVAGTIFFCNSNLFDVVIKFIKKHNYRAYFVNNLYDTNIINVSNSLIHFVERLFGVICV